MLPTRQFVSADDLKSFQHSREDSHSRDDRLPPCDLQHNNWFLSDAIESHHHVSKPKVTLPMQSFNHIAREVLCIEKSRKFYCDILGFQQVARPPFDCSGYWLYGYGLSLHLVETTVPVMRKKLIATRIHHFSFCLPRVDHIAFISDNLDIIRDILDREKVFYKADSLESSGISQIFFFDPDGNVIEISNCAPKIGDVACTPAVRAGVSEVVEEVSSPNSTENSLLV